MHIVAAEHNVSGASQRQRLEFVLIGIVLAAGAALLFWVNPSGGSMIPACPFHALTGLHCAGCGTARALHALLHGRVLEAFSLNVLAVSALPFLAYAFAAHGFRAFNVKRMPLIPLGHRTILLLFAVIVAFSILRNIPVHPFTWLAP